MEPTVADMRHFLERKIASLHDRACTDFDVALESVTDPALFSLMLGRAEQLTRFPGPTPSPRINVVVRLLPPA